MGSPAGWASDSCFWHRSWSQGCGKEAHGGLHGQQVVCLRFFPSPATPLSQVHQTFFQLYLLKESCLEPSMSPRWDRQPYMSEAPSPPRLSPSCSSQEVSLFLSWAGFPVSCVPPYPFWASSLISDNCILYQHSATPCAGWRQTFSDFICLKLSLILHLVWLRKQL